TWSSSPTAARRIPPMPWWRPPSSPRAAGPRRVPPWRCWALAWSGLRFWMSATGRSAISAKSGRGRYPRRSPPRWDGSRRRRYSCLAASMEAPSTMPRSPSLPAPCCPHDRSRGSSSTPSGPGGIPSSCWARCERAEGCGGWTCEASGTSRPARSPCTPRRRSRSPLKRPPRSRRDSHPCSSAGRSTYSRLERTPSIEAGPQGPGRLPPLPAGQRAGHAARADGAALPEGVRLGARRAGRRARHGRGRRARSPARGDLPRRRPHRQGARDPGSRHPLGRHRQPMAPLREGAARRRGGPAAARAIRPRLLHNDAIRRLRARTKVEGDVRAALRARLPGPLDKRLLQGHRDAPSRRQAQVRLLPVAGPPPRAGRAARGLRRDRRVGILRAETREDLSLVGRGPGEAPPLRGERAGPGHGEESRAGRPARALRGRLLPPRLRGAVRPRHVDLADDSLPRVQEVPPGAAGRGRARPLPLPRHRLRPAPAGQGLGHAHRPRRGCRPVRDGALLPHPVFRGAPLPHPCRRTDRRGFKRPDLQRLEDLPVRPCKAPHARRVQRREPCHGGGERDEVRRSLLVRRIGRPRRPGVRGRRGMVHEGRDARDRGLRLLRLPSLLRRGHDPRAGRGLRRGGRPQGGRAMKGSPEPARRLAVVLSHPTQYYSPWFRWLRSRTALDFHVFYLWDFGVAPRRDPQFGTSFEWDVDLLSGYDCEFVPNMSAKPGADRFFGFRNPGLPRRLSALGPDALLLFGYKWASHLRAVAWARRKGVPI